MKNIYEILTGIGLELPEDKKEQFDKEWKENYRTKAEYDKAVEQREEYKTSLGEVQEKLVAFQDVNVDDLKGQIENLKAELVAKDTDYAQREADRAFEGAIDDAIRSVGGRNAKAIKALLDMETLKASKNQIDDIKKALESAKESDAYLFGKDEPINNVVGATGGAGGIDANTAAMRAAAGLPPEK